MVPCFRRDGVWIPAYAGMTDKEAFQRAKVLQIIKFVVIRSIRYH